jgi:hypothetical protein
MEVLNFTQIPESDSGADTDNDKDLDRNPDDEALNVFVSHSECTLFILITDG